MSSKKSRGSFSSPPNPRRKYHDWSESWNATGPGNGMIGSWFRVQQSGYCPPSLAHRLLPFYRFPLSAFCFLLSAFCFQLSAFRPSRVTSLPSELPEGLARILAVGDFSLQIVGTVQLLQQPPVSGLNRMRIVPSSRTVGANIPTPYSRRGRAFRQLFRRFALSS